MTFLELLSSKLNEFLRGYQTDQPMVPVLAKTLETLLRSFMSIFIFKRPKSVTNKNLFRLGENTDIEMGAKLYVSTDKRYLDSNGAFWMVYAELCQK